MRGRLLSIRSSFHIGSFLMFLYFLVINSLLKFVFGSDYVISMSNLDLYSHLTLTSSNKCTLKTSSMSLVVVELHVCYFVGIVHFDITRK